MFARHFKPQDASSTRLHRTHGCSQDFECFDSAFPAFLRRPIDSWSLLSLAQQHLAAFSVSPIILRERRTILGVNTVVQEDGFAASVEALAVIGNSACLTPRVVGSDVDVIFRSLARFGSANEVLGVRSCTGQPYGSLWSNPSVVVL